MGGRRPRGDDLRRSDGSRTPARLIAAGAAFLAACGNEPLEQPKSAAPTASSAPSPSSAPPAASSPPPAPAAIDPACKADGCLRAVVHVGDYDRSALQAVVPATVAIDNGYSVFTITYWSSGRESKATVTIPLGVAPPAAGYHVVANNHGTTGLDDPCAVAATLFGAGLSGTFGARGFIGVAVDYPGLGTEGTHPYLVAEVEGRASFDAMRATRALAATRSVPLSNRFAVVGLSQGGHAALAAAAMHAAYAPDVDVRAFAATAPASVFEEHWRMGAKFDGPFAAVHAMLIYAWATQYGFKGPPLWTDATAQKIHEAMQTACIYSATGAPSLSTLLGERMDGIFSPSFLEAYRSGNWGHYAPFEEAFRKNRIGPYRQTAPLKIYQGDRDLIVPETSTRQLVEALRAGGVNVEYEVVPGGTHSDVAFGFLAVKELRTLESIAWVRSKLDAP